MGAPCGDRALLPVFLKGLSCCSASRTSYGRTRRSATSRGQKSKCPAAQSCRPSLPVQCRALHCPTALLGEPAGAVPCFMELRFACWRLVFLLGLADLLVDGDRARK